MKYKNVKRSLNVMEKRDKQAKGMEIMIEAVEETKEQKILYNGAKKEVGKNK